MKSLKMNNFSLLWIGVCIVSLIISGCGILTQKPLNRPTSVSALPDGSVYIVDRGNYRVVKMDADGHLDLTFGKLGSGQTDFYRPWDSAVDSDGNIYICNMVPDEAELQPHEGVKVFDKNGKFLKELGGKDFQPDEERELPYGLDIDDKNRIFVIYTSIATLKIFDQDGNELAKFFGENGTEAGQFQGLIDVAVDDERNLVYLSDQTNSNIQQFELSEDAAKINLVYRQTIGEYGRSLGQFAYPTNLAVDDESGNLYVGDMANQRIQVLDTEGKALMEFMPPNTKVWQVLGLATAAGKVYAADPFNNVIWEFDQNGSLLKKLEVKP